MRLAHHVDLRAGIIACKQRKAANNEDDQRRELLASLNAGMNSWTNFNDEHARSPSKNAAKQKTKRKGKDGKLYLRDGPKRPADKAKPTRRPMSTASSRSPPAGDGTEHKVRIEESKSGGAGKRTTTVRGLPSDAAKAIVKELKAALSVGGRVNARGELELQGAHGEVVMLRLLKAGYGDVRLAGGAGSSSKRQTPVWNAPKEVRERAAAQKQAEQLAKQKRAEEERAAARSPAAVATRMLAQLRASEAIEVAKLRRSDVPKEEKRLAQAKLERIQRRIDEAQTASESG
jgi:translation initiation factor 1 (eIF-1/SUI1)